MDDIMMIEVCKIKDVADMLDEYASQYPELQGHMYQLKCNLYRECDSYLAKNLLKVRKAKDIIQNW